MRATKKHYGSDNIQKADTAVKTKKARKGIKTVSFVCAVVMASAALVIPTTTLAPNVDAYEDSRAASFAIGGLDQFSAVITNNCAEVTIASAAEAVTSAGTTAKAKSESADKAASGEEKKTAASSDSKTDSAKSESSSTETKKSTAKSTESASSSSSAKSASPVSYNDAAAAEVSDDYYDSDDDSVYAVDDYSYSSGGVKYDIDYPDYNYHPQKVNLSSYDRAKMERLVMGEAGSMKDELGILLVAQAIRDAMNRSNTTSIDEIISSYQYFGSTAMEPNERVKKAVSYIIDENGSAIQHRVMCFYIGSSAWHETQQFLIEVEGVRFFDLNY